MTKELVIFLAASGSLLAITVEVMVRRGLRKQREWKAREAMERVVGGWRR